MNKSFLTRIKALEEQAASADEGYEFFRTETYADGSHRYVLTLSGKILTLAEFAALVQERGRVAFIPLQPPERDAEAEAYWSCMEPTGSWTDLLAENAGGPVAFDFEARLEAGDERAELARRYARRLEAGEGFWDEVMRRCGRGEGISANSTTDT